MLLVLYSFQSAADLDDLREAYNSFRNQEVRRLGVVRGALEVESTLEELEGSFVRCERYGETLVVAFHNPSIRDFLQRHIADNKEYALLLCESIVFYDQFRNVFTPQATRHQPSPVRIGEGLESTVMTEAAVRTVPRTAKRHVMRLESDGGARLLSLVSTTPEKNAAHALRMAKDLPSCHRAVIAEKLVVQEIGRVREGTMILEDLPEVLVASAGLDEVAAVRNQLIEKAGERYEEIEEYDQLEKIIALKNFAEAAPDGVEGDLLGQSRQDADRGRRGAFRSVSLRGRRRE